MRDHAITSHEGVSVHVYQRLLYNYPQKLLYRKNVEVQRLRIK